jgi:hypothetical protein
MLHAVGVNQRKKKLTIYDKRRLLHYPTSEKIKTTTGAVGR